MILCTGGESCGTRLAVEIVESLGGEAIHRSFPHGGKWPALATIEFDAAIVMTRDWWSAIPSQVKAKHVSKPEKAEQRLRRAYAEIPAQLNELEKPWRFVSYEALIAHPNEAMSDIANWLDLREPVVIRDENRKWHEGPNAEKR